MYMVNDVEYMAKYEVSRYERHHVLFNGWVSFQANNVLNLELTEILVCII